MSAIRRNVVQVSSKDASETLILLHGFGIDQGAWSRVAPSFDGLYRVVRYDLSGLGNADPSAYQADGRHASLRGHAEDLREICDELGVQRAALVGHSVGAMIAVLAAIAQPERFSKLALLSGSACYLNEPGYQGGFERAQAEDVIRNVARDYVAWCDAIVPVATGEGGSSGTTEEVLRTFRRVDPAVAHHFFNVILFSDLRAELPRMRAPALVIQAARDAFVPLSAAQYLAAQLPDAKLHVLAGHGGHYPHLGSPQLVSAALRDFLLRD